MIGWDVFLWFGGAAVLFSALASIMSMLSFRKIAIVSGLISILILLTYIAGFWIALDRPPLRTTGETRLWYSFFASVAGLLTYVRWRYKWIISFSTVLSTVFILLNILKPEIHDQTLMPALQSVWFIPHVTVYMFSYSLLGCAFLISLVVLSSRKNIDRCMQMMSAADTLIYIGAAFLTFGMLSGALWAKQAWGHYWSWDMKETWALITWLCYMLYIHLRLLRRGNCSIWCILLIFAFVCLQMCWWGVNLLPAAKDSMHVY